MSGIFYMCVQASDDRRLGDNKTNDLPTRVDYNGAGAFSWSQHTPHDKVLPNHIALLRGYVFYVEYHILLRYT